MEEVQELHTVSPSATSRELSARFLRASVDSLYLIKNVALLPVVSDPHTRKLVGGIRRKEFEACQKRILHSVRTR